MKCQILFSGKNKKNIISLSSAENAQRVVKVKKAMSGQAGVGGHPRFTFWLTFFSKLYVTFIFQWIAFIFGRDEEEDQ